jgi:hypothetical protein
MFRKLAIDYGADYFDYQASQVEAGSFEKADKRCVTLLTRSDFPKNPP